MDSHSASHDSHHDAHHVNYMYVFVALCVFTVLSIFADLSKKLEVPHGVVIVMVLAIATAKALSVMLYFMHLKFERNWKYVLLAPTTILAIGVPLALLPDVAFHYYVDDVPQVEAYEEHVKRTASHDAHSAQKDTKKHTGEKPLGKENPADAHDHAKPEGDHGKSKDATPNKAEPKPGESKSNDEK